MFDKHSSRLLKACALLCASVSLPAMAQNTIEPPAEDRAVADENGVNVATGRYRSEKVDLVIGSGPGQLEVRRASSQPIYNEASIDIAGVPPVGGRMSVSVGRRSYTFLRTSGGFESANGDGARLVRSGDTYTLTSAEQVVYLFNMVFMPDDTAVAKWVYLSRISQPNGLVTNINWDIQGYTECLGWGCAEPQRATTPNVGDDTTYIPQGNSVEKAPVAVDAATMSMGQYSTKRGIRLASITNSAGYRITYGYELAYLQSGFDRVSWHRLINATGSNAHDSSGSTSVSYSESAQGGGLYVFEVADALNHVWSYRSQATAQNSFEAVRRPGSVTDDLRVEHNGPDHRVSSILRDGQTWTYAYTSNGDTSTLTVTNPLSGVRQYTSRLSIGLPTRIVDEAGRVTDHEYDTNGRLVSTTEPGGRVTQFAYDSRGNVQTTTVVPAGGGTSLVTSAVYPTSCLTAATCNLPTSTTDARGVTTSYTYDPTHGGVTSAITANTSSTSPSAQMRYGQVNGVWLLTSSWACRTQASCENGADAAKTVIGYNSNLLPVTVTAGAGDGSLIATTTTDYTAVGDIASVNGPLAGAGDVTRNQYNAARQLVATVGPDPDGGGPRRHRAARYEYRSDGKLLRTLVGSAADGAGNGFVENLRYGNQLDAAGRVVRQTLSSGGTDHAVRDYLYDALGRVTCTVDHMNPGAWGAQATTCAPLQTGGAMGPDRVTQIGYDAIGRVTGVTSGVGTAEASTESRTYAPAGGVASVTDGQGNVTSYGYDGFNRPTTTSYPGGSYEQLAYATNGDLTSVRLRDNRQVSISYDALGRRSSTVFQNPVDLTDSNQTYAYDLLGRPTSISDGNGHNVGYVYDALGRVTSESSIYGTLTSQYDVAGRRTRLTWGDGFFVTYEHDMTGAMTAVREYGGTVLASYGYDDLGRRVSRSLGNGTSTTYGYDGASRLTVLALNGGGQTDSVSMGYNPAGQIASRSSVNDAYAWTGAVNLDRTYSVNGLNQYTQSGNVTPTYDARGNLTSAGGATYLYNSKNQLSGANGTYLYYDAVGRLDQVTQSGLAWQWDGNRLVTEYQGGSVARRYVHGAGVDEPIVQYDGPTLGQRRWLDADERGSIVRVTNDAGGVVAVNSYDEYGIPGANNYGRFQYTGQMWMPELGFYHYKARMYSPTLGRFLQTDSIGYADGPNLYAYVGGDPVNRVDPTGMQRFNPHPRVFEAESDGNDVTVTLNIWPSFDPFFHGGTVDAFKGQSDGSGASVGALVPQNAHQGCAAPRISPAERRAAQNGDRGGFWNSRASRGDPLSGTALSIVNNSNFSGQFANFRLRQAIVDRSPSMGSAAISAEVQQIGVELMQQHVVAIDRFGSPTTTDIANYHRDVFNAHGLPASTFGGTMALGSAGLTNLLTGWAGCRF